MVELRVRDPVPHCPLPVVKALYGESLSNSSLLHESRQAMCMLVGEKQPMCTGHDLKAVNSQQEFVPNFHRGPRGSNLSGQACIVSFPASQPSHLPTTYFVLFLLFSLNKYIFDKE